MVACSPEKEKINLSGKWIGEISMQGKTMPFEMQIQEQEDGSFKAGIINGEEEIILDEIEKKKDSLISLYTFLT